MSSWILEEDRCIKIQCKCCGLILLLVEYFFKPAHSFLTSLFFSNQEYNFKPAYFCKPAHFFLASLFFSNQEYNFNQQIYQLSKKGFLSFGVWFKNTGMAFWWVWKQNITGKLISSSSLPPFPSFPIILTPISIHVYIIHTPSTTTATPCLQILLTMFLLTFLPEFEPLPLIYRLITIPELSPPSHRELVTNPTHKCWYE